MKVRMHLCYAVDRNRKLRILTLCSLSNIASTFLGLILLIFVGNQAFCEEHLPVALEAEYPTKVIEFIRFCGANSNMHTLVEGVDDLSACVNIHQNQIEKLNDISEKKRV